MLLPGFPRALPSVAFTAVALLLWTTGTEAQLPDAPMPPASVPPVPPPPAGAPEEVAPPAEPEAAPEPPAGYVPRPTYPELSPPPGGYDEVQPDYGYRPRAGLRIPTEIAARMRTLETDLNLLASRGGGRIADGVISLVAGGAFFTVAAFIDDPLFRSLLFMTAGVAVGRGLVDLLILPDADKLAIEYSHMPMASVQQVRDRLGYGEHALELLAQRGRVARMVDGSIAMTSGAVTIGVFVARPPCPGYASECRFKDDPINYIVIVGGGISIIGGLVGLLVRSEAERRWMAYTKLRDRLREEATTQNGAPIEFALPSFAPLPGGAAMHWGMRF